MELKTVFAELSSCWNLCWVLSVLQLSFPFMLLLVLPCRNEVNQGFEEGFMLTLGLSFYAFFILGFCPQFTATLVLLNSDLWFFCTGWLLLSPWDLSPVCCVNYQGTHWKTWIKGDLIAVWFLSFKGCIHSSFCLLLIIL